MSDRDLGDLQHELNNTLFGIQLALDAALNRLDGLERGEELDAVHELVERGLTAAERAGSLVAQLTD